MPKLKTEWLKSKTIKIYNTSLGKFYNVTREQLVALKESGKLDPKYDSMFEPEPEQKKVAKTDVNSDAAAKAAAAAKADSEKAK